MGATAALHLREVLDRATSVLAIEALCAARGLDLRLPLRPAPRLAAAHATIRERVPPLTGDRSPAPDIAALAELIASGALLEAAGG